MKKIYLIAFVLLFAAQLKAQEPANYAAVANKFKQFYNANQPDSIFAMFSPEMKASLPLDKFKPTTVQLKSQLGSLKQIDFLKFSSPLAIYKGTFTNAVFQLNLSLNSQSKIIGLFLAPYVEGTKAMAMDPSLKEAPILLKTFSGSISGTLTTPANASGKIPVVLIIPGSGPTDRDGNSPKLGLNGNTYKMLANELGKNGIASLRYDKRLIGQSITTTKEKELKFEDYVDDAVGLVNLLSDDQRFSKVIVLGHSEGSLVGMLAIRDQPVKAYISVAGAGRSADIVVTEQMKAYPKFIQDNFKRMLDSLKRGKFTDNIDPKLYPIARPDIQPYLLSWFRYSPAREIKKAKIPVLIVQGTTDLQVPVTDADLLKKAKSDAVLLLIPNMNHILKEAPADKEQNTATYSKPDLPLKPELVTGIVNFIKGLK
ncbi:MULTISPECIES: alpha/beta fold hydrolase [unclassified Mucilaginibacter]|uniref:alpha/beta fold hydrolase n=1 Tax=unclassified Mucilaginibacter TaxID=2617802 RepID=UPI002AC9DE1F|nr:MULTISPECIES: alpha/beta fold hydrolase [unclassified Mucilaginibacter]MEB0261326.1 alpha/beta hydrolase [Mucilaginibacter sp. 10I4]MEB0280411.1 alpha/beta hydrolase [Mucilaginibacter sp. 10B2]MEB0300479.1 alpha/beta hydrolase [Mucilaginibacter sp. 5C4]WPX23087.1 alpha/beta hydrolase [Mucilaginibacter sp. 5C4]